MQSRTGLGRLAFLAALVVAPGYGAARDFKAGDLLIEAPWARATPNGAQVAAGYVTIVNHGTAADTLTGGSLEAADRFEVHEMKSQAGVMTMRPVGRLTIPAGGSVVLSPAGLHIMFSGLKHGLKKGQDVTGTLVFEHAGTVPVHFAVEGIGAKAPAGASQPAMPGMTMD